MFPKDNEDEYIKCFWKQFLHEEEQQSAANS